MNAFEGLTPYVAKVLTLVDQLAESKLELSSGIIVGALLVPDLPDTDRLALITCLSLSAIRNSNTDTNTQQAIQSHIKITGPELEAAKELIQKLNQGGTH